MTTNPVYPFSDFYLREQLPTQGEVTDLEASQAAQDALIAALQVLTNDANNATQSELDSAVATINAALGDKVDQSVYDAMVAGNSTDAERQALEAAVNAQIAAIQAEQAIQDAAIDINKRGDFLGKVTDFNGLSGLSPDGILDWAYVENDVDVGGGVIAPAGSWYWDGANWQILKPNDEPLTLTQNAIDQGYSLNGQELDVPTEKSNTTFVSGVTDADTLLTDFSVGESIHWQTASTGSHSFTTSGTYQTIIDGLIETPASIVLPNSQSGRLFKTATGISVEYTTSISDPVDYKSIHYLFPQEGGDATSGAGSFRYLNDSRLSGLPFLYLDDVSTTTAAKYETLFPSINLDANKPIQVRFTILKTASVDRVMKITFEDNTRLNSTTKFVSLGPNAGVVTVGTDVGDLSSTIEINEYTAAGLTYFKIDIIVTSASDLGRMRLILTPHFNEDGSSVEDVSAEGYTYIENIEWGDPNEFLSTSSEFASTKIDSSAAAIVETLEASTNEGVVRLFTNIDVTNTAALAVQAGETLNGVVDGTFRFSNYTAGTQFRADEVTGGWVVSVVGASTQTGLDYYLATWGDSQTFNQHPNSVKTPSRTGAIVDNGNRTWTVSGGIFEVIWDPKSDGAIANAFSATITADGEDVGSPGNAVTANRNDGQSAPAHAIVDATSAPVVLSTGYSNSVASFEQTAYILIKQLPTTESVLAGMVTPKDLTETHSVVSVANRASIGNFVLTAIENPGPGVSINSSGQLVIEPGYHFDGVFDILKANFSNNGGSQVGFQWWDVDADQGIGNPGHKYIYKTSSNINWTGPAYVRFAAGTTTRTIVPRVINDAEYQGASGSNGLSCMISARPAQKSVVMPDAVEPQTPTYFYAGINDGTEDTSVSDNDTIDLDFMTIQYNPEGFTLINSGLTYPTPSGGNATGAITRALKVPASITESRDIKLEFFGEFEPETADAETFQIELYKNGQYVTKARTTSDGNSGASSILLKYFGTLTGNDEFSFKAIDIEDGDDQVGQNYQLTVEPILKGNLVRPEDLTVSNATAATAGQTLVSDGVGGAEFVSLPIYTPIAPGTVRTDDLTEIYFPRIQMTASLLVVSYRNKLASNNDFGFQVVALDSNGGETPIRTEPDDFRSHSDTDRHVASIDLQDFEMDPDMAVCLRLNVDVINSTGLGNSIGVNYSNGAGSGELLATDIAGVVPYQNWNNLTAPNTAQAFVDSEGNPLALTVTTSPDFVDTWNTGGNADAQLFADFLNFGTGSGTLELTNVPYARFDVVLLFSSFSPEEATVTVGGDTQSIVNTNPPQGTYTDGDTYLRFSDLSGDVTFNITPTSGVVGLAGFQIIEKVQSVEILGGQITTRE